MRLVTFSGIGFRFSGNNDGEGMRLFAEKIRDDFNRNPPDGDRLVYLSKPESDHFRSYININPLSLPVRLFVEIAYATAKPDLDAEADHYTPIYAKALAKLLAVMPAAEPLIVLAHSQGTNIGASTLAHLYRTDIGLLANRPVRCVMFDPKVDVARITGLFGEAQGSPFSLLFFQSEMDPLGNQNAGFKFIDEFKQGDHLWVASVGHGSITEFEVLDSVREMLTYEDYVQFRAVQKEYARKGTRGHPNPNDVLKMGQAINALYIKDRKPLEPLYQFIAGRLDPFYQS